MKSQRAEMILCALFGGVVGALCLICFPVSLFGAIAVGLYLRIKPEIYITPLKRLEFGGLAGSFTAVLSTLLTWLLYSRLMAAYGAQPWSTSRQSASNRTGWIGGWCLFLCLLLISD